MLPGERLVRTAASTQSVGVVLQTLIRNVWCTCIPAEETGQRLPQNRPRRPLLYASWLRKDMPECKSCYVTKRKIHSKHNGQVTDFSLHDFTEFSTWASATFVPKVTCVGTLLHTGTRAALPAKPCFRTLITFAQRALLACASIVIESILSERCRSTNQPTDKVRLTSLVLCTQGCN